MLLCPNCRARVPQDAERCARCGSDVRVAYVSPDLPARERTVIARRTAGISRRFRRALVASAAVTTAVALGLWLTRAGSATSAGGVGGAAASASPLGKAPVPIGSTYLCPLGYPFRAYDLGRLFYPPNHPRLPLSGVRPTLCFATRQQAVAKGYTQAVTPPGVIEIDGVYLLPADLLVECRSAARTLRFFVPCPSMLPSPALGVASPGCGQFGSLLFPPRRGCVVVGGIFYFQEAGFAIPPGFAPAGAGSPPADFIATAFRVRRGGDSELMYALTCPDADAEPKADVSVSLDNKARQVEAQLLYCPTTVALPMGGHLLVRWTDGPIVYQVALSGNQPGHRDLLLQLTSLLHLVGPD
jgi:hypothetical protein